MSLEVFRSPLELKLAQTGAAGTIEGYGAVFGNVDSHGDVIERGAFRETLEQRRHAGRGLPPMRKMHGLNNMEPVGVWESMTEDAKGLHVRGRLIGLDTPTGRQNYAMVCEGALRGLSIGYKAIRSRKGYGAIKRHLDAVHLSEISIVDEPSNPLSVITDVKFASIGSAGAPVIEGFATRWHAVHENPKSGGLEAFARNCFSNPVGGAAVRLLLSHNDLKHVSVAANGLRLLSTDDGLAFRAELAPGPFVDEAMRMLADGHAGMSVGYTVQADRKIVIEGTKIRVIDRAELSEISIVRKGAVATAFVIPAEAGDFVHRASTGTLACAGASAKVIAELKRLSGAFA